MKWTVTWVASAQNQLADLWVTATDRGAIADASNALDSMLRLNPFGVGESRSNNNRVAYLSPLGITYDVHDEDRIVKVLAVWQID